MRLLKIVVSCFSEYSYVESAAALFERTLISEKLLITFWKVNYLENYLLLAIEIICAYNQLIFGVFIIRLSLGACKCSMP